MTKHADMLATIYLYIYIYRVVMVNGIFVNVRDV